MDYRSGDPGWGGSSEFREESSASDEELLARVGRQDLGAFEAVYDRYGHLVYATALRVVSEIALAEDVTQEVFLRLWRRPSNYVAEKGRLAQWLLRVARNRSIDELRRQSRRHKHESTPAWTLEDARDIDEFSDPASSAVLADNRRMVQRALATLPPEQRQVIDLAYFHGLTQQEIADLLQQPLGTVKTRIRLGMKKLKSFLSHQREDETGTWDAKK